MEKDMNTMSSSDMDIMGTMPPPDLDMIPPPDMSMMSPPLDMDMMPPPDMTVKKQALFSIEQYGEIGFYKTDKSVEELLKAANEEKPFLKLMKMGQEISDPDYAEIQQSKAFTYSVKIDLDNNKAEIYEVNQGKGGISEGYRNSSNVKFTDVSISDYGRKQQPEPKAEQNPESNSNSNELETLLEQMQNQEKSEKTTSDISKNTEIKPIVIQHEQLIPVLNAKAVKHENKLQALEEKKAVLTDKIKHNQDKITALSARAEKLEDANKLLKSLGGMPFVKSIMENNQKKIETIKKEQIPQHKHKISQQQEKFKKLSAKQTAVNHKLERCRALSKVIQSFSIVNSAERRKNFSEGLAELQISTKNCLTDKVNQMQTKKNKLMQKYENVSSAAEKFQIQQKINALSEKISETEKKIGKIKNQKLESASALDNAIQSTKQALDTGLKQNMELSIPVLSQAICQDNTQSQNLKKSASAEKEYTIAVVTDAQMEQLVKNHFPFAARKTKNEDGTTAIRFEKSQKATFEQLMTALQQKKPKLSM